MARLPGRPRQFVCGPKIIIQLPALTHVHLQATAKARGQSMSQVVRDCLAREMEQEWGAGE